MSFRSLCNQRMVGAEGTGGMQLERDPGILIDDKCCIFL